MSWESLWCSFKTIGSLAIKKNLNWIDVTQQKIVLYNDFTHILDAIVNLKSQNKAIKINFDKRDFASRLEGVIKFPLELTSLN